jgi:hypothetical protein
VRAFTLKRKQGVSRTGLRRNTRVSLAMRMDVHHSSQMEEPADAIDVPHALSQEICTGAMQALHVLLFRARNTHDAAGLAFASMPSHEHPNETLCVGAVGLEPPPAPAHLEGATR